MAMMTIKEVAEATGLSKGAIQKAIKAGRVSAHRDELGVWKIDAAEAHRAYPDLKSPEQIVADRKKAQEEAAPKPPDPAALQSETELLKSENASLKTEMGRMEELNRQIVSERDYLRENLRTESEERRSLTRLLANRPEPQQPPQPQKLTPLNIAAIIGAFAIAGAVLVMMLPKMMAIQ